MWSGTAVPAEGPHQGFSRLWLQYSVPFFVCKPHSSGWLPKSPAQLINTVSFKLFLHSFLPTSSESKIWKEVLPQSQHHRVRVFSFFYNLSSPAPFELIPLKTYLSRNLVTMVIKKATLKRRIALLLLA